MTMTEAMPVSGMHAGTESISDEELTAQALAADPEAPIAPDAVAWSLSGWGNSQLLPVWYMPAPVTGRRGWRPKAIAAVIILGFALINGFGLCITYGHLVPA